MRFHQVKLAVLAALFLLAGCKTLGGGAEGPLLNDIAGMMKPGDGVYLELQGGVLHATGTRYPIRGDTFEIPLQEVTISGGPSNIGPQLEFRCKGFQEMYRQNRQAVQPAQKVTQECNPLSPLPYEQFRRRSQDCIQTSRTGR